MKFEYDPDKSIINKLKHGIDFEEAQVLWADSISLGFSAKNVDEERFAIVASYQNKIWVAFYTIRGEKIRIISVRRARKRERKLYES